MRLNARVGPSTAVALDMHIIGPTPRPPRGRSDAAFRLGYQTFDGEVRRGGVVLLDERVTTRLVIASVLILGGVALAVLSRPEVRR